MIFNSFQYLLFLPAVFLLYWLVFKKLRWQNLFLLLASYFFYACWDWKFLFLIIFTTACSYFSGILIYQLPDRRKKKLVSAFNIVINLAILGFFKYFNFFEENLVALFALFGVKLDWVTREIILPVGISFYTFQALGYSIDVYRGKLKPVRDFVSFMLYLSFFPQLIAGPIETSETLLPQVLRERRFDYAEAVDGLRQILWGLFKKVVIADNCAAVVNQIFPYYTQYGGVDLVMGAVMFSFQIYCDFSAYSDIAIGSAKLLGIRLMRNFNYPYFSRSVAEFWNRWHISLMFWLRNYVYIPLGGSRCSIRKHIRNTLIVFAVSGIWHGANWTFIVWGLYNAVLFIPLILKKRLGKSPAANAKDGQPQLRQWPLILLNFVLMTIGLVIFRSDTLSDATDFLVRIVTQFSFTLPTHGLTATLWVLLLLVVEWLQRDKEHPLAFPTGNVVFAKAVSRQALYLALVLAVVLFAGANSDFIYFQF